MRWREAFRTLRAKSYPVPVESETILTALFGGTSADEDYNGYYSKSSAVYACVRRLAVNVAKPPLVVYQRGGDGAEPVDSEHPLQVLLDKVNPWWTRSQFWRAVETSLSLHGQAFVLTYRKGTTPQELWWIDPTKMRAVPGRGGEYVSHFEFRSGINTRRYESDEVIWLRYHNPADEFTGLSPLSAARMAAEAGYDALAWNRNFFRNDATPGRVYIKTDQELTKEQSDEIKEQWAKSAKGVSNAHRVAVFGKGAGLGTLSISQRDAEFVALQRLTLEDICRIFGVPPPLVADLERATYSNIKEAKASFWHETVLPELEWLRDELNESALVAAFGPDLYCDFDVSQVEALQEDANLRATRYQLLVSAGIKTINEIRAEENLDPVAWGDAWWISLTQTPVSSDMAPEIPTSSEAEEPAKYIRRALDDDTRLDLFLKRLTPMENKFKRFLQTEFAREEAECVGKLTGRKADVRDVYDADEAAKRLAKGGQGYLNAMVDEAGREAALELSIQFDLRNPRVQRWLGDRLKRFSHDVSETTQRAISEQLRLAEVAGESSDEAAKRIRDVFADASRTRSERIARTEMVSASNRGALEAYIQSGVVERKRWLAAQDERTRPTHAMMHGVETDLMDEFIVGADRMLAPGEGLLPEENVNCRCIIMGVINVRSFVSAQPGGNGHGQTD